MQRAGLGWLFGFAFGAGSFFWITAIPDMGALRFALLAAVFSLYYLAFGVLYALASRSIGSWIVLGAGYTLAMAERYREAQLRTAQLEKNLVQAEMKALKAQLQPHFLFNTLNTISVLVREGQNDCAVSLIARLSSLLRTVLEATGQQEVPLQQEIDFLRRYLDIQSMRFPDRLEVSFDLEPGTLGALVPKMRHPNARVSSRVLAAQEDAYASGSASRVHAMTDAEHAASAHATPSGVAARRRVNSRGVR